MNKKRNLPPQIKISSVVKKKLRNSPLDVDPAMVKKLVADYCERPKGWNAKRKHPSDPPITKIWRPVYFGADGILRYPKEWVPGVVSKLLHRFGFEETKTVLIKFNQLPDERLKVVEFTLGYGRLEHGVFKVTSEWSKTDGSY